MCSSFRHLSNKLPIPGSGKGSLVTTSSFTKRSSLVPAVNVPCVLYLYTFEYILGFEV
jgi:hypothetical protein